MGKIFFKLERQPENLIECEIFEGESILEVALDNHINLNHNCGGVCGCSTCHIYIDKGEVFLPEITDKEEDFVDRARNPKFNSRLACQCIIKNENADMVVTIPDQSGIIGH